MSNLTRKNKRHSKKRTTTVILILSMFLIIIGTGIIGYMVFSSRPLFISPLPVNYRLNASPEKDKNLNLVKKLLTEKKIEYREAKSIGNNIVIFLKNKSNVIISQDKDLPTQIASLQFILTRLTMESKAFRELDLRFDKPVIRK